MEEEIKKKETKKNKKRRSTTQHNTTQQQQQQQQQQQSINQSINENQKKTDQPIRDSLSGDEGVVHPYETKTVNGCVLRKLHP